MVAIREKHVHTFRLICVDPAPMKAMIHNVSLLRFTQIVYAGIWRDVIGRICTHLAFCFTLVRLKMYALFLTAFF